MPRREMKNNYRVPNYHARRPRSLHEVMDSNPEWRTNSIMAGMFSLLNNNLRSEGGQCLPIGSSRDDCNGGRMTPRTRTPVMNRRNFYLVGNNMNYNSGENRLPKRMRKRTEELHPMLRRSVCAIIIAIVIILSGIIFVLVDFLALSYPTSVRGMVILIFGLLLVVIGVIWFRNSQMKLEAYRERKEQARLKKMKSKLSNHQDVETVQTLLAATKHASKWPARRNCNGASCRETLTSPNGNHVLTSIFQNHQKNHSNCPRIPGLFPPQQTFQNEVNGNKAALDDLKTLHRNADFPIRIDKNGESVTVSPVEQCTSCAFFSRPTCREDRGNRSHIIPLTT